MHTKFAQNLHTNLHLRHKRYEGERHTGHEEADGHHWNTVRAIGEGHTAQNVSEKTGLQEGIKGQRSHEVMTYLTLAYQNDQKCQRY